MRTTHLLWGTLPEPVASDEAREASTTHLAAPAYAASALLPEADPTADPGSAFGMVILISNRTSREMVDQLLDRIDGPRALFLEDVCGTADEALGQNCHGGGE